MNIHIKKILKTDNNPGKDVVTNNQKTEIISTKDNQTNNESQFFIITPPENFKLNKAFPITINGDFEQLKVRTSPFYTDLNGFWVQLNPTEDTEGVETDYVTLQAYEEDTNYLNKRGLQTLYSIWKQDSNNYVQKTGDTMTGKLIVQDSVQEGYQTTASGNYSHTEGYQTTASGNYSHAEGFNTVASEARSHAEGSDTLAAGEGAHAEGYNCQATNLQAHAEGAGTKASAQAAHAEGAGTTASALDAHAEGNHTIASALDAHAEGTYSTASGRASHSEGRKTVASGENSHSEGFFTKASGKSSHAEGAVATTEHILNGATKNTTTYTISGRVEVGQHIVYSINNKLCQILTTSYDSAEDLSTITVDTTLDASSKLTNVSVLVFWQDSNLASGDFSHTEGQSTIASGESSHAEGNNTIAFGKNTHAEGNYTYAARQGAHAEGGTSEIEVEVTDAIFQEWISDTSDTSEIDDNSTSTFKIWSEQMAGNKDYCQYTIINNHLYRVQKITLSSGSDEPYWNITVNPTIRTEDKDSIAFEMPIHFRKGGTFAWEQYSHAEGENTIASGYASHAEGRGVEASGYVSHAEGYNTMATSYQSHAEGNETTASGNSSHAEGIYTTASGQASHAEGNNTIASGESSHVEGNNTIASGEGSHAEGFYSQALGDYSHAEGIGQSSSPSQTTVTVRSHTIPSSDDNDESVINVLASWNFLGGYFKFNNHYFHITNFTRASDEMPYYNCTIKPGFTISEAQSIIDNTTTLEVIYFGRNLLALGECSHAEGAMSQAIGMLSHAEGQETIASGSISHTEGTGTVAEGNNQHVQGTFNIVDTTSVHIVGNGTGANARSNAHTLDTSGNAWFAGDVYVGSTSGKNKDLGSKKLATEEYVDTHTPNDSFGTYTSPADDCLCAAYSDWNKTTDIITIPTTNHNLAIINEWFGIDDENGTFIPPRTLNGMPSRIKILLKSKLEEEEDYCINFIPTGTFPYGFSGYAGRVESEPWGEETTVGTIPHLASFEYDRSQHLSLL